jgi:hypothetical protein
MTSTLGSLENAGDVHVDGVRGDEAQQRQEATLPGEVGLFNRRHRPERRLHREGQPPRDVVANETFAFLGNRATHVARNRAVATLGRASANRCPEPGRTHAAPREPKRRNSHLPDLQPVGSRPSQACLKPARRVARPSARRRRAQAPPEVVSETSR